MNYTLEIMPITGMEVNVPTGHGFSYETPARKTGETVQSYARRCENLEWDFIRAVSTWRRKKEQQEN